jgi:hypothetical protein
MDMLRAGTIAVAATTALLITCTPASAAPDDDVGPAMAASHGGWTPVSIPPFDAAAGVLCAFPVHYDAIVNQARTKVVATYPDGSPKRELGTGALFLRLSNTDSGASTVVDTSDSVVIDYRPDGSRVMYTVGPVIALVREGTSNLARGIYAINGIARVEISPTGFKTITLVHADMHSVCPDLG